MHPTPSNVPTRRHDPSFVITLYREVHSHRFIDQIKGRHSRPDLALPVHGFVALSHLPLIQNGSTLRNIFGGNDPRQHSCGRNVLVDEQSRWTRAPRCVLLANNVGSLSRTGVRSPFLLVAEPMITTSITETMCQSQQHNPVAWYLCRVTK